jgi:hypothetical protein
MFKINGAQCVDQNAKALGKLEDIAVKTFGVH